jgi:FMN-dependent NADH-azoreductase
MFPAVVKLYFESVTVSGLTFVYGENGIPKGLCSAKKLIYVTTSGGPIIHNFGYEYVAALAKSFYGIKEVKFISAQGLDIKGADADMIMQKAKGSVKDSL